MLLDGQIPLYTLSANDTSYAYSIDKLTPQIQVPGNHPITPVAQGFVNQMLRREFNAVVAVRNYNP